MNNFQLTGALKAVEAYHAPKARWPLTYRPAWGSSSLLVDEVLQAVGLTRPSVGPTRGQFPARLLFPQVVTDAGANLLTSLIRDRSPLYAGQLLARPTARRGRDLAEAAREPRKRFDKLQFAQFPFSSPSVRFSKWGDLQERFVRPLRGVA
jgi:hypothetical protein